MALVGRFGEIGADRGVLGNEAIALVGVDPIIEVAQQLRAANCLIGANMCEWASRMADCYFSNSVTGRQ